jgi:hypothetical protein
VSYVSDVIIISPHMEMPDKVIKFVSDYYAKDRSFTSDDWTLPVINSADSENDRLLGGGKFPGGSVMWIGWNYFRPDEFISALKAEGFEDLTVWWETEHEFMGIEKINWTLHG